MRLIKILSGIGFLIVLANSYAFAGSIESEFETRYKAWRCWISKNKHRSTFTACKEYSDIVALGLPALPLMIKKMEECPSDFHLSTAVSIVSKREFDYEEWPKDCLGDSITGSRMYINWWRVGRFQTGTRFNELYARWRKLNGEKEVGDAERVYKQIVNLGIPVMPYLVEIVDECPEFVAAVSELSGGALSETARSEEVKKWWDKNKERFTPPPLSPDEEAASKSSAIDEKKSALLPNNVAEVETTNVPVRCEHDQACFPSGGCRELQGTVEGNCRAAR